jgi:hypothetical protein
MSSSKRILSSRANGARSRGPTSAAGKKASSLNAVRHGLLAQCVVLCNESREGFDAYLDQHIRRYNPIDDVELAIVEEMVVAIWRLRRAWAMETRLLDDAILAREPGDELGRLTGAFTDIASSPALALLHRYEARLHNMRHRALKNIQILRNTPLPNEPSLDPASPAPAPAPTPPATPAPPPLPNEPTLAPASPTAPAKLAPPQLPNEPTLAPTSPAEPPRQAARVFLYMRQGGNGGVT